MKNIFIVTLFSFLFTTIFCLPSHKGIQTIGSRIIGGNNAISGQFNFAASIQVRTGNSVFDCVGTIITNQWILTAGQCAYGATLFTILMGTIRLSDTSATKVVTDTYILHPDFDPITYANDIALIKLRLPITFTSYIQQIHSLPSAEIIPSEHLETCGWGQTSDDVAGLSDHLQYVVQTALSNDECKIFYGSQITENMVCIAGKYNEGICIGDSGAPLLKSIGRHQWAVVGVGSFLSGNGCEDLNPSVFTRTLQYVDWIRNTTGRTD